MSGTRKFWSYQCEWDGCSKSFKSVSAFEAHYRRHTDQPLHTCDHGSCTEAFHDQGAFDRHRRTHADERPFAYKYESRSQAFMSGALQSDVGSGDEQDNTDRNSPLAVDTEVDVPQATEPQGNPENLDTNISEDSSSSEGEVSPFFQRTRPAVQMARRRERPEDETQSTQQQDSSGQKCFICVKNRNKSDGTYPLTEKCSHGGESLDQHHHRHTDQCPFTCKYDSCGQAFYGRGELTEHHRSHKQRPLACEYESCSRTFAQREKLEAHMHMHTKERPFTCSYEGCNKSFGDYGTLIHHKDSHPNRDLHLCSYESCTDAFNDPLQLHHHYREDHEKATTSVKNVRPIRLRLTQPKRPNPESLEDSPRKRILLRLPIKKILANSSSSDIKKAHGSRPESDCSVKRSSRSAGKGNMYQDASLSNPISNASPISDVSGSYQVSSRASHHPPPAIPHIPRLNSRPQAPAMQPAVNLSSAENDSHASCVDEESSGPGISAYTSVCGIYSPFVASPIKATNRRGRYHCPRCDTQYTRSRGVMRHFFGCIEKYGNPDSLKWTDHPSLERTAKYYARNGYRAQEYYSLPLAADVKRKSRELPLLRSLEPRPLSSRVEDTAGGVEPVYEPPIRDVLGERDIVRPIQKRRDALRRSNYNPETVARDVLLATGSHPNMDPLNAHLDILQKRFRFVNDNSNMSTFRWDLVDSEQDFEKEPARGSRQEHEHEHEHEPEKKADQGAKPEKSASNNCQAKKKETKSKLKDVKRPYDLAVSLPSRPSMKPGFSDNEVPFRVILPDKTQFGPMSTVLSTVFERDPSAKLMSCNEDLWAAVFTMLEYRYHGPSFTIRAAVRKQTGDIIGWVACHEVDTLQAKFEHPSAYLDWITAAQLLPPQISRFTSVEGSAKDKAERSHQRKVGHGLASKIQAQASEAQDYLVPIRRLVINALVVHPLHQGRGVASALLTSITEIVDVEKRPVWIQAPEDPAIAQGMLKAGLFRRAGFMCAGELNLDLDSYASDPQERSKGKGISLGTYKWNYMLRWPQPVAQKA